MSKTFAETYYKNYWDKPEIRRQLDYYELRYKHLKKVLNPKGKILDVGGGTGQFMLWLEVKGTVFDISASGLKKAKAYGFDIKKGNIENKFPFADSSFDAVICFEVLEHLKLNEGIFVLNEIKRCLKPNGLLYLGIPNMKADGIHHKTRWHPNDVMHHVKKTEFELKNIYRVPAFIEKSKWSDLYKHGFKGFIIHSIAKTMYYMPFTIKMWMAQHIDSMTMITIVEARTKNK